MQMADGKRYSVRELKKAGVTNTSDFSAWLDMQCTDGWEVIKIARYFSADPVKDEYEAKVRALEEQIAAMKTAHDEQLRSVQEGTSSSERIDMAEEGKEELATEEAVRSDGRELEQSGDDDWWR